MLLGSLGAEPFYAARLVLISLYIVVYFSARIFVNSVRKDIVLLPLAEPPIGKSSQ